jgi:hypothetical protein
MRRDDYNRRLEAYHDRMAEWTIVDQFYKIPGIWCRNCFYNHHSISCERILIDADSGSVDEQVVLYILHMSEMKLQCWVRTETLPYIYAEIRKKNHQLQIDETDNQRTYVEQFVICEFFYILWKKESKDKSSTNHTCLPVNRCFRWFILYIFNHHRY